MADNVEKVLEDTGMLPANLILELTESAIMEKPETVIAALIELRELGVEISVDDFGTGYSSLGYLKRFPIDSLKIDGSFISDVNRDPEDAAIVSAVVIMGHTLKMKVIAEGVETLEQVAFLRSVECDMVQGFVFAEPLSGDELARLLRENRRMSFGREAA